MLDKLSFLGWNKLNKTYLFKINRKLSFQIYTIIFINNIKISSILQILLIYILPFFWFYFFIKRLVFINININTKIMPKVYYF